MRKMVKRAKEGGDGEQEPSSVEASERDRLLGALAWLMDVSWGKEMLFRQIVMHL